MGWPAGEGQISPRLPLSMTALGIVLLVMMWRGETIDGNTDLIGSARLVAFAVTPYSG